MNKTVVIGRLVRDSDLTYSQSGTAICKFTIAVDRTFKNKNGEKETDFLNIVTFNKLAELCGQFIDKGKMVAVDGRIQTGNYMHKDGYKVYTTDIVADNVQFLSPKGEQQGTSSNGPFGKEVDMGEDITF